MFRTIPGYSDYQTNRAGEVICAAKHYRHPARWSVHQWMQQAVYYVDILRDGGARHKVAVRKLVMLTFRGPAPQGTRICHQDGNPRNHHLRNLDYVPLKKLLPKVLKGRARKLSDGQVSEIRRLIAGGLPQCRIAERFAVDEAMISKIKMGQRRASVGQV